MAGRGQRFVDQGYKVPKPLVMVDDKSILDYSFNSVDITQFDLIFLVRADHCNSFGIDKVLRQKFGEEIKIIKVDQITDGSVSTCLLAKEFINNDRSLTIYTLDVNFSPAFDINKVDKNLDGLILTFKANNSGYSYALTEENGKVIKTAEKDVISENAAVGIYHFRHGCDFVKYAEEMINRNLRTRGEFFISPLFNLLIEDGANIGISSVEKMYVLGTPEELRFFQNVINKKFGTKPIALCCDHSGLELKNTAKLLLENAGFKTVDFGTHVKKDCDYLDYVSQAAQFIQEGWCDFGFGFCRTGQGVNIAANKQRGIRSALISDEFTAEMAVRHNAANFFCFSEKNITKENLEVLIWTIKRNSFDGGRFSDRIIKLEDY